MSDWGEGPIAMIESGTGSDSVDSIWPEALTRCPRHVPPARELRLAGVDARGATYALIDDVRLANDRRR